MRVERTVAGPDAGVVGTLMQRACAQVPWFVTSDQLDGLIPEITPAVELALAAALTRRGRLDEAAALLESAAAASDGRCDAELGEAYMQLAKAWSRHASGLERSARAEAALRRAAALHPPRGLRALAQHVEKLGRPHEAIDHLVEAVRLEPREGSLYLRLARLYQKTGQVEQARRTYLDLVEALPSAHHYLIAAQGLDELDTLLPAASPGQGVKVAMLGSATLDHVRQCLSVECFQAGLRPRFYQAGFDQYSQEILNPSSGLYAFEPDVVVCAIHASRLFPRLHAYPFELSVAERESEIDAGLETIQGLLDALTARSSALVLLHNVVAPQHPVLGIQDIRDEYGQAALFSEINRRLAELARTRYRSVYVVDEDRVQARCGKARATDPRHWYTARMGWSDAVLPELAREYMRYLRPFKALSRKCIVLDLDNTLWGGVVGEDGISGIQLGQDAPGNAFTALQRELDHLWKRGILLAVCSKNNQDEALAVFHEHPGMVLKLEQIAAHRINWEPKATNIRAIADELNIGLDSLVFLDDNPIERAAVRAELPEVLTPELPPDPAHYRSVLVDLGVFDTLVLTDEDWSRNRLYKEERARRESEARSQTGPSLDAYLESLGIEVEIAPADDVTIPRIAQLTSKTNQFNLTTRRYTEAQIRELQARGCLVYGMRVRDRFGDQGLVGVSIVVPQPGGIWELDTLLLSCRVLGRGVESALLATVADEAGRGGASWLQGWYIPTGRNTPAADCYRENQFVLARQEANGGQLWQLDLAAGSVRIPSWLAVRVPEVAALRR